MTDYRKEYEDTLALLVRRDDEHLEDQREIDRLTAENKRLRRLIDEEVNDRTIKAHRIDVLKAQVGRLQKSLKNLDTKGMYI